jgi:hypothetical protein
MKKLMGICILAIAMTGCDKDNEKPERCDIQKVYAENAAKVTITTGIWGTVSSIEGDCMPMVPPSPSSCSTHCPVKRIVRVYQYTTANQATPSNGSYIFFDNFSTTLVAETEADANGFYQVSVPPGQYTVVNLENGKLHAKDRDAQSGLNPVVFAGGTQKANLVMAYKIVF